MNWLPFTEHLLAGEKELDDAMQYGERLVFEDCIDDKCYTGVVYRWKGKLYFTSVKEIK